MDSKSIELTGVAAQGNFRELVGVAMQLYPVGTTGEQLRQRLGLDERGDYIIDGLVLVDGGAGNTEPEWALANNPLQNEIAVFSFAYFGEWAYDQNGAPIQSLIAEEVYHVGLADIFEEELPMLYAIGKKALRQRYNDLVTTKPLGLSWVAVYNYWVTGDGYYDDYDSGIKFVGRLSLGPALDAAILKEGGNG